MKKCIACMGALMILSASAFGQGWWDRQDWTLISDTPAGNFSALYGAGDATWLYLRLDLDAQENPFTDGLAWHFGVDSGGGLNMFDAGTFYSDAMLWSGGEWAGAVEQRDGVWSGDNLLDGPGGADYRLIMSSDWYQPFDAETSTLYYRVDRSQLYHDTIGGYLFDGGAPQIQVGARRGTDDAFISGSYVIPEPGTMSLLAIGLLGVIGLRRRLK